MGTIIEYIGPLLRQESLSFEQAEKLLDVIFEGGVPEAEIAAFLTAMRIKGATAQELAGLARSLRSHAVPVKVDVENLVDTCGTGGAVVKTFNISTAAALVAAGAGVYVAKHGNRGITSSCGSADVLAKLGVKIDCGAEAVAQCIRQAHIGFMFAPMFHPAMKYVQPVRKSLGFGTVFNILGPLANPAGASAQVMGVADAGLMGRIVETLKLLGVRRAMVVHSNGLDEINTSGVTRIAELKDGRISNKDFRAADFGIVPSDLKSLKIFDAENSAKILTDILTGKENGPAKDIVLLNAAAAIIVSGLADDFPSAIDKAKASIASGRAIACLEKLIEISNGEW
jgi:anthranilate phosphoribosyltransferase